MTQSGGIWINPVPIAFRSVAQGLSARKGLLAARAAGVAIRDATWFRIYSQAKAAKSLQIGEAGLNVNRIPASHEIAQMSSKTATGYVQYVEVYARDIDTGDVTASPFAVRGHALQTRNTILEKVLAKFRDSTAKDGPYSRQTILGAAYTATYQYVPRET